MENDDSSAPITSQNCFISDSKNDDEIEKQQFGREREIQPEFSNVDYNELQENDFIEIPELPSGHVLRLELLSPWDDPNFVGLAGIELFAVDGTCPPIEAIWTNALESDGDLKTLIGRPGQQSNVDAIDSNPMWLCNYRNLPPDSPDPIYIGIRFDGNETQTLAMIRIWNYASCRVHSLRGVRQLRIWLDQQCIFQGEICCAYSNPSHHIDASQSDTILFTTNEDILAKIAENDETLIRTDEAEGAEKMVQQKLLTEDEINFPMRKLLLPAEQQGLVALLALQQQEQQQSTENKAETTENPHLATSHRPTTGHPTGDSASSSASSTGTGRVPLGADEEANKKTGQEEQIEEEEENLCVGKVFHIELLSNWGSPDSIGLNGIQFLGPHFEPFNPVLAKECQIRCEPADASGADQLTNLLNGKNLTCRPEEIWLMRWVESSMPAPMLSFTFPHEVRISGISIWNYNASAESSYAGVRCARFYANGRPINGIGSILLRKAPGFVFFDFVQDVLFDRCPLHRSLSLRPQTRSVAAFIFQIRLLSSWGDEFYIGLNGIELFNRRNQPIRLRPQNLAAFPESVNCLASVNGSDPRTSDKLIDGVNETTKAHHMWLTPILPNSFARIFIIFDTPTFVTQIRIYNYRKTPQRGVRHIAISADDLLICSGAEVPISTADTTGVLNIPLQDPE